MKCVLFLLLMSVLTAYGQQSRQFNFSLETKNNSYNTLEHSISEDEIMYDSACDRTVLKKNSFLNRVFTRAYSFWYGHSYRLRSFILKKYRALKTYMYTWYIYVYNYGKRVKK